MTINPNLLRKLSLFVALLLAVPAGLHAQDNFRLQVDLSKRVLTAYEGDHPLASYDVAIGNDDYPTPAGSFKIRKVILNPTWVPPDSPWAKGKTRKDAWDKDNPMKRVKMFFQEPDYYIHGTAAVDSLGEAESHGCIRMHPKDVTELVKMVMAHGGKWMPEPWYKRIFRSRQTKVVILSIPVPVQIGS